MLVVLSSARSLPGLLYVMRALRFVLLMFIIGDISRLFVFAIPFGIFDCSAFVVPAHLVVSYLGTRVMGLAMELLSANVSLGGALGAVMGGYLFDLFARYQSVRIASIALAAVAGFLSFAIRELPDRRSQRLAPAGT